MPEGHTLYRLAIEHTELFAETTVAVSSPQGRFADAAARLDGLRFDGADSYGKHLFHHYADGSVVHVHLGLYGVFTRGLPPPPPPVGAVRMRLAGPRAYVDLRGATVCELVTEDDRAAIIDRLGPDPLRTTRGARQSWPRVSRSRAPVAGLLMDQSVAAGVGNVFRAEVLFRAGLDPFRPGRDVDEQVWADLWTDLRRLMRSALRSGRIVTTRPADRRTADGMPAGERAHYVYRRAGLPCRRCGTPVATTVLAGRNLFWCPSCQQRGAPPGA